MPHALFEYLPVDNRFTAVGLNQGLSMNFQGREPLRGLQHGNILNEKLFLPIYLFKVRKA